MDKYNSGVHALVISEENVEGESVKKRVLV